MKNRLLIILSAATLLMLASCADDSLGPVLTFEKAGKGAYVKLLEVTSAVDYDLAKFSTTSYDYMVEFVDIENGNTVEQYDIFVSYQDNTPDNGDNTKDRVLLKSFSKSDFTVMESGAPGMSVSLPLSESAAALGLSESDMSGADFINYNTEVTTADGAKFGFENSSAAVNGSAFAGHFRFSVKLNCPLEDSQFSGTYTLTYVEGGDSPVGGVPIFGAEGFDVEVSVLSATRRSIDVTYLPDLGIGNTAVAFDFEFVCSIVNPDDGQSSGLACAGGILFGQPRPADLAQFDLNDDSTFDITFLEDQTDDCGAGAQKVTIRLTKK